MPRSAASRKIKPSSSRLSRMPVRRHRVRTELRLPAASIRPRTRPPREIPRTTCPPTSPMVALLHPSRAKPPPRTRQSRMWCQCMICSAHSEFMKYRRRVPRATVMHSARRSMHNNRTLRGSRPINQPMNLWLISPRPMNPRHLQYNPLQSRLRKPVPWRPSSLLRLRNSPLNRRRV